MVCTFILDIGPLIVIFVWVLTVSWIVCLYGFLNMYKSYVSSFVFFYTFTTCVFTFWQKSGLTSKIFNFYVLDFTFYVTYPVV